MIWRCKREIHLVRRIAQEEERTITHDERSNIRRYKRIIEQVELALKERQQSA